MSRSRIKVRPRTNRERGGAVGRILRTEKGNPFAAVTNMDRGDGIIRWSPSKDRDEFFTLELNYHIIQRYKAEGYARPERFDYHPISKHNDFQSVSAIDWSPKIGGLVAVGGKGGEVQLLRIDDDSNDSITLPLKLQRSCQALAFNTTGLLAVGLDRVRNDQCLQIWDIDQRLSKWDPSKRGWQSFSTSLIEPVHKLEPSLSVTSVKFWEDQPQTLVVGIKNQSLRIHDLRDPHGAVITFQTRCNNNIAIDHADPNYFASSALDYQYPNVMIWDRRAASRQTVSKMYLESVEAGEIPFGCVLKLSNVVESRNQTNIRTLRYCRDQRGCLAVLSTAGELQVLCTEREFVEPLSESDVEGSPELLEVRRSYPLQYPYFDENFGCPHDERVVSSDWATLGTPDVVPRLVTRRGNSKLGVILLPTTTPHVAFTLTNFSGKAKHGEHITLPPFMDPEEAEFVFGPTASIAAQFDVVFHHSIHAVRPIDTAAVHPAIVEPNSVSRLRSQIVKTLKWAAKEPVAPDPHTDLRDLSVTEKRIPTSRQHHEESQYVLLKDFASADTAYAMLNALMLQRCRNRYLFNCENNRKILADDPWLQDVWHWIEGAENIAKNDGMVSGTLDLSYMGVCSVWKNDLGNKFESRIIDTADVPGTVEWQLAVEKINDKAQRTEFEGANTERPHHRQLCLAICGWAKSSSELEKSLNDLEALGQFTKAAAWALYENAPQRAVEILKRGGKDLLFIGLALDLKMKGGQTIDRKDWDNVLQKHPQMAVDPYLRAIYALISTGDWKTIADETSLPLRDRVGVAIRNFDDVELSNWLERQMSEVIKHGDIEGIVLAGVTDRMVDVLAKYIEKFGDYQSAALIMSYAAPLYIDDYRCSQWREAYRDLLNANKRFIDRCRFDVASTRKSRQRDGTTAIKPPPRQVTLRCVRCDTALTNDQSNTANPPAATTSNPPSGERNPLYPTGVHAGISCPKCGRHLGRCAVCLQTLGMPRTDRPELSTEKQSALANFMTFCLKCDHACHADHSRAWFQRHNECPAPDCRCSCNEQDIKLKAEYEARKILDAKEMLKDARTIAAKEQRGH